MQAVGKGPGGKQDPPTSPSNQVRTATERCCCQLPRPRKHHIKPWGSVLGSGSWGQAQLQRAATPLDRAVPGTGTHCRQGLAPAGARGLPWAAELLSSPSVPPPGLLRATQDASGAWPQPPSLSAGFLPCSPHPVPGALAGAGALCSGGRGAVGGGAGPARPGGGRFRRGELPQTQNRCWQQN